MMYQVRDSIGSYKSHLLRVYHRVSYYRGSVLLGLNGDKSHLILRFLELLLLL